MGNEETIFAEAMGIEAADARSAYLDQACGGDAVLRQHVEALLAAHERAAGFMQSPAPALGVTAAANPAGSSSESQGLAPEPLGASVGPYKLLERIGEGGMGVVYMADQLRPVRRRVALKIIKPGMDSKQVIARFEAERQALAMMDHPSIARVLDAGTTDAGRPYFAMELVKGVPITEYCDKNNLTPRERLGLFVQVCQAVQHAHTKGVIHRDLKPSNILVTLHDGVPVPKVIDFGIAKATGGAAQQLTDKTLFTQFAQMIGTPLYMSPEQAEMSGLDVDTRSDVYSLGVLLYELLTGTTPFDKKRLGEAALDEVRRIIREEEPPRPSTRVSTLGETLTSISAHRKTDPGKLGQSMRGELDWIVMKTLEKDRTRRYETANGLGRDVERYLADETVQACPPSAIYRFRKLARRNKPLLATTALVCAALFVGTLVSTWLAVRATRAEGMARVQAENAETQARKAKTEAAVSQAVNEFLNEDLLAQASPENEPDRDVKLRTVLDRAAERVERGFKSQPLVEAAVRLTLGKTYESLGEYPQAERHFRRAAELRASQPGGPQGDTFATLNLLAWACARQHQYVEAESLSRDVLEKSRRALGEEHPATVSAMHTLAAVLLDQGKAADSEALARRVLEIRRRTLGDGHRDTLSACNGLGNAVSLLNRLAEAAEVFTAAVSVAQDALGEEHPLTLILRSNLARVRLSQDRYAEAEEQYLTVLETERRVLGPEHPHTTSTTATLANLHLTRGRFDESERLHREALQARLRRFGESHLFSFLSVTELAGVYERQGRSGDAEELYRESLTQWRAALGDQHPQVGMMLYKLGDCVRRSGQVEMALPLLEEAASIQRNAARQAPGDIPRGVESGGPIHDAAYALNQLGRKSESERAYREALTVRRAGLGDAHPGVSLTVRRLASVVWEQRKPDEARAVLREHMTRLDGIPDVPTEWRREAIDMLVDVNRSWGQSAEVTRLLEAEVRRLTERLKPGEQGAMLLLARSGAFVKLQRFSEAEADIEMAHKLAPGRRATSGHLHELGLRYAEAKDWVAATRCYRRSLEIKRDAVGDGSSSVAATQHQLAAALHAAGNDAEAERLYRRALAIRDEQLGRGDAQTNLTRNAIADLLTGAANYSRAEEFLLEQHALLAASPDSTSTVNGERRVIERIIELYRAWGKPDRLSEWNTRRSAALLAMAAQASLDLHTRPGDMAILTRRGALYARAGRFIEAAADLDKVVQRDPSADRAWFQQVVMYAAVPDLAAYRRASAAMFAQFEETKNPDAAERTIKANLLVELPAGPERQRLLTRLESLAVVMDRNAARGWNQQVRGMLDYHGGRFEAAVNRLQKGRAALNVAEGHALCDLYLAMALHRLGRSSEARGALARAAKNMDAFLSPKDFGPNPHNWIVCQITRPHAEALLSSAPVDSAYVTPGAP